MNENQANTVIYIENMTGVKTVPGSNIALVYGETAVTTKIISLDNFEVIAEIAAGYINEAFVSSDGQTGYLMDYRNDNTAQVVKISIDGASSTILNQTLVGHTFSSYHVVFGEFDQWTTSAISPNDSLLLFGYDDPVNGALLNIIDAGTLDLLASPRIPESRIFGFAFTEDSKRVITLAYPGNQVPIVYLDGKNSFVENTFNVYQSSYSGCYNPVDKFFYVLDLENYIHKVDPFTGDIVGSIFLDTEEWNWRIAIDQQGNPLVLNSTSMIYDGVTYPMPGISNELIYNSEHNLFLSAVPGPDVICIFDPLQVGIQQFKPGSENEVSIFPNPASDQIIIKSSEEITRVKVCNIAGTEVYSGNFKERNIEIPIGNLAPGVYVIDVTTKAGNYSRKMVVRK
jgi:hypothetical protein